METPATLESEAEEREAVTISRREYDEETVVAVDFGRDADEPTVDVVGGTAIVVLDGRQLEFDVPDDATEVTVNDGILTIRSSE